MDTYTKQVIDEQLTNAGLRLACLCEAGWHFKALIEDERNEDDNEIETVWATEASPPLCGCNDIEVMTIKHGGDRVREARVLQRGPTFVIQIRGRFADSWSYIAKYDNEYEAITQCYRAARWDVHLVKGYDGVV